MSEFINYIVNLVSDLGYTGIFIMMVIESSFIPFPSEIAMIPAGFLASIGKMNFFNALLSGTLGGIVGASINYFLGKYLGHKVIKSLIHNYGKYILINEKYYLKSEKYFKNHGTITIFISRFIPAIRQLISIPAGIFKMCYYKFIVYTGIGVLIWNIILMSIGYIAGENKELINEYIKEALIGIVIIIIIIAIIYYFLNKKNAKK